MNAFFNKIVSLEKTVWGFLMVFLLLALVLWFSYLNQHSFDSLVNRAPIKVGVLHSLSGTMAKNEKAVANATLLAIEQINATGGLLGRLIDAQIADGQSNDAVFAQKAKQLINEEKVSTLFACWTSACRKTLKPIVEASNTLLFYSVQYEGIETSKNIIYTGATPNQQITISLHWLIENLGKKIYLVGSDYIFPHVANTIIKDYIDALNAEVVGEIYLPLGSSDVAEAVEQITRLKPDIILNTINGDTNLAFFKALYAMKDNRQISTVSYSMTSDDLEEVFRSTGLNTAPEHYLSWSYFQGLDTPENRDFVQAYHQRFGSKLTISAPMEAAYVSVMLWADAIKKSGSFKTDDIRSEIINKNWLAPEGLVYVDPKNQHLWKKSRLGKLDKEGKMSIVWESKHLIEPIVYLPIRTKKQWLDLQQSYYKAWGDNWANLSGSDEFQSDLK
ncbi:MAG: ABC transporter substrate-binding protein [Gammaproteobacteria bacterium]|nr:ABC transporter substrate-binding protein [Gammaproteobacteria bacterium]